MPHVPSAAAPFAVFLALSLALLGLEVGLARAWWRAVRHRAPGVAPRAAWRAVLTARSPEAAGHVLTPAGLAYAEQAHRLGRLMRVAVGLFALCVGASLLH